MRTKTLIATIATAALLLTPAGALAGGPPSGHPGADHAGARNAHPDATDNPGATKRGAATPGPHAGAKAKRRAYGRYCATESRKHVKGEHGTPFSRCVTALAKLSTGQAKNPTRACKPLSRKHLKGEHGTPFSRCVSGAAKLLEDQQATDDDGSDDTTSDSGTGT